MKVGLKKKLSSKYIFGSVNPLERCLHDKDNLMKLL